jgi:hypothetical protein
MSSIYFLLIHEERVHALKENATLFPECLLTLIIIILFYFEKFHLSLSTFLNS